MSHPTVPLPDLAVAVQNAVQKALAQHGAVPVDKLWVGFVAPESIATEENARKIVQQLNPPASVHATPVVAKLAPEHAQTKPSEAAALPNIGRIIIGLIFEKR